MLQKLLPWQLQEELLWQRELQVQKGPVAASPLTMLWTRNGSARLPGAFSFTLCCMAAWANTLCCSCNERGDITNLFVHPNV